jgi:Ca2+-binding EF-hand superfamily protein
MQLKKITATYLASHLSEHEISRIHGLFEKIDANNDGFISMQELQAYLGG